MSKSLSMEQAKAGVLALIKSGSSVADACRSVSRSTKSYENWRSSDRAFADAVDSARERRDKATASGRDADLYLLSFAEWRKRFLGLDTYPHQQLWVDVLEGRAPTLMHNSVRYEPADPDRILINTPPFHAKSATITQQWVTYKLCMNPAMRIMIVGKTAESASKHLFAVRQYLTDPNFMELQAAYAPADGFKPQRGEGRWANNLIYLAGRNLDAADKAAKDPSVQAVGMNGQIYGARCDLIILDDAVDDTNYAAFEKQFDWLTRTVQSRIKDGKLIIVGTRIKPMDLYAYLLNGDNYMSGKTPWTYLAQPAVFEYAEDPKDWKTLWPKSSTPMDESSAVEDENGLYQAWDGPALERIRGSLSPGTWALVYQQQQVSEDMTFHPKCVWGSIDKRRQPGPLRPGEWGGRRAGMEGMHTILSIDPAGTGEAFLLIYAVDRVTKERYVLNAWTGSNTKISWYHDMIQQLVPEYGITDLVIEKQGYSNWLYQDERIVEYCRQRGVRISPHYCVDTETEVLSRRGWLRFDELQVGEEILTLSASGTSEWLPTKGKYVGRYSGTMHRSSTPLIDALTTPDHKWPVSTPYWDKTGRPLQLVESRFLNKSHFARLAGDMETGPEAVHDDSFVELVGWVVTEGSVRAGARQVLLSQSEAVNPAYCERIRAALHGAGAEWTERDNGSRNGVRRWSISGGVAEALRAICPPGAKTLPREFIHELAPTQRSLLRQTMVDADGWRQNGGEFYCSDSDDLLGAFEMLCALDGFSTSRKYRSDDPGHGVITVRRSRGVKLSNHIEQVEWSGTIWCPSTDNGTFYARRNGVAYFTGNTGVGNKIDPDFGVASLAGLFGSLKRRDSGRGEMTGQEDHAGDNLIWLPNPDHSPGIKALIDQLLIWIPGKSGAKLRQDGPMALWFAEMRTRSLFFGATGQPQNFVRSNRFLSARAKTRQTVRPSIFI